MPDIFEQLNPQAPTDKKSSVDIFEQLNPTDNNASTENNAVKENVSGALGLGVTAGIGYGAYKITKGIVDKYREPWNSRDVLVNRALKNQKEVGLQGGRLTDVPSQISNKINYLKKSLSDMDNTILKEPLDNVVNKLQGGYQQFYNNAYNSYGSGLDIIDSIAEKSNIRLNTEQFKQQVIDPVISRYEGSLELVKNPELAQKINALKSNVVDKIGKNYSKNIKVSDAKNIYKIIQKDLPVSSQYKLKESWGNYLEKNTTGDIQAQLSELNKSYRPIAESRNAISKFYNTSTGEFNKEGVVRYFQKYIKSKYDTGVKSLVKLLSEGNKLTKPIEGLGESFNKIEDIKVNQIGKLTEEISDLSKKFIESKDLLSKIKVAQKRVDNRSIMNKLSKAEFLGTRIPNMFSKGLPYLGVIPQVFQAKEIADDPSAWLASQETGIPIDKVRVAREIFSKAKSGEKLTPEEWDMLYQSRLAG